MSFTCSERLLRRGGLASYNSLASSMIFCGWVEEEGNNKLPTASERSGSVDHWRTMKRYDSTPGTSGIRKALFVIPALVQGSQLLMRESLVLREVGGVHCSRTRAPGNFLDDSRNEKRCCEQYLFKMTWRSQNTV
jgi:hypothetical protein